MACIAKVGRVEAAPSAHVKGRSEDQGTSGRASSPQKAKTPRPFWTVVCVCVCSCNYSYEYN